jgi:hypothetical protein
MFDLKSHMVLERNTNQIFVCRMIQENIHSRLMSFYVYPWLLGA